MNSPDNERRPGAEGATGATRAGDETGKTRHLAGTVATTAAHSTVSRSAQDPSNVLEETHGSTCTGCTTEPGCASLIAGTARSLGVPAVTASDLEGYAPEDVMWMVRDHLQEIASVLVGAEPCPVCGEQHPDEVPGWCVL